MTLQWWQLIILAFVEGFSWVLPLSDSGFTVLARKLTGLPLDGSGDGLFTALGQITVALVVACIFRGEWAPAFRNTVLRSQRRNSAAQIRMGLARRMVLLALVGLFPAVVPVILRTQMAALTGKLFVVALVMFLGGFLVFSCDRVGHGKRTIAEATFSDGFMVAFFQLLGCIPGLSSVGLGMTMGVWRGMELEFSVKFSCLLMVPALLLRGVAGVILHWSIGFSWAYIIGMLICGLSAYLSLRLIRFVAQRRCLGEFAVPVWGASLFLFILYLFS